VLDCSKTVPKPNQFSSFGLSLSEKQIPQIVENNESRTDRMKPVGRDGCAPKAGASARRARNSSGDTPSRLSYHCPSKNPDAETTVISEISCLSFIDLEVLRLPTVLC